MNFKMCCGNSNLIAIGEQTAEISKLKDFGFPPNLFGDNKKNVMTFVCKNCENILLLMNFGNLKDIQTLSQNVNAYSNSLKNEAIP